MRSEGEIRKQVEARLRRWGLLALNAILWIGAAKIIFFSENYGYFSGGSDVVLAAMVGWLILLGLHTLRVAYIELREYLVQRAVNQEQHRYEGYEKRKRIDTSQVPDEDGELVDFPALYDDDEQIQYRGRN